MIRGLDASAVQEALPYKRLYDEVGCRFVILKAQQGNDGFDPWFERNMKAGLDAGFEVFAYCFYYPLPVIKGKESRDPKRQAQLFVDRVYRFKEMQGRPIFIDEEWPEVVPSKPGKFGWKEWGCSPQQLSDSMEANVAEVQRLTGVAPVLYTYDWWWAAVRDGVPAYGFPKGADVSWAAQYELWMAWYTNKWPGPGSKPRIPKPWSRALFWQFDGNGGLVLPNGRDSDFCVFDGTEDELRRFAGRAGGSPSSCGGAVIEDTAGRA